LAGAGVSAEGSGSGAGTSYDRVALKFKGLNDEQMRQNLEVRAAIGVLGHVFDNLDALDMRVAETELEMQEALRLYRDMNHLSLAGGITCENVIQHVQSTTLLLFYKPPGAEAPIPVTAATFSMRAPSTMMLRLLATNPRMTRKGFARVTVHFLKELCRALSKSDILVYTYPSSSSFYKALNFHHTNPHMQRPPSMPSLVAVVAIAAAADAKAGAAASSADGAAADGAAVDGAADDGAAADGAASDGAAVGAAADCAVADGAVANGAATDGAASDSVAVAQQLSREEVRDARRVFSAKENEMIFHVQPTLASMLQRGVRADAAGAHPYACTRRRAAPQPAAEAASGKARKPGRPRGSGGGQGSGGGGRGRPHPIGLVPIGDPPDFRQSAEVWKDAVMPMYESPTANGMGAVASSPPLDGSKGAAAGDEGSEDGDGEPPPRKRKLGNDDGEYVVQDIAGVRAHEGEVQYQIKWKGWGAQHNTWEPRAHLTNLDAEIAEFEASLSSARS